MDRVESDRAGKVGHSGGNQAFIPNPLPPRIEVGPSLWHRLGEAERSLGWISGRAADLDAAGPYAGLALRKEAVLSARLEGNPVALPDLLWYALDGPGAEGLQSARGVVQAALNYVQAAEKLLPAVREKGFSTVTLQQAHRELYGGLKGRDEAPGNYRSSEIWIGPSGSTAQDARYVPPPNRQVPRMMQEIDHFLKQDRKMPQLVAAGLLYYQLETVPPFVDGNGRVARLSVQLFLGREPGLWPQFVGLASVFGRDPRDHFGRLQRVRLQGDWEGWISYFLGSVREAAEEGGRLLNWLIRLRCEHRQLLRREFGGTAGPAMALLDSLFSQPLTSVAAASGITGRTFANTNNLIARLESRGLLAEISGRRRHRRFCYQPFLDFLQNG